MICIMAVGGTAVGGGSVSTGGFVGGGLVDGGFVGTIGAVVEAGLRTGGTAIEPVKDSIFFRI